MVFYFFACAIWVTLYIPDIFKILYRNLYLLIISGLAFFSMWLFCLQIGYYLVKPLFISVKNVNNSGLELTESDCPQLFSLIKDIAQATGNEMPKHVYLSAEVNACVFYDSVSIWSIFFPPKKNLMIGIGLFCGMNISEIKAVLGHEFGHFSQKTMRVGTITYRLLLMIHTMTDYAQKQLERDAVAKTQEGYRWYFHIAGSLIAFVTRRTINMHRWIEKKDRSLSRFMEFEADTVACRVAGSKAMISSLCKLNILSERFSTYENVLTNLIENGNWLKEYWEGYIMVYKRINQSENLVIESKDILEASVGDNAKFPSKITIIDGWNTHPALSERIEHAKQLVKEVTELEIKDARFLINKLSVLNTMGVMHQQYIMFQLRFSTDVKRLSSISLIDFKQWFLDNYGKRLQRFFISVFLNKVVAPFPLPSVAEMTKEEIENPFTEANRNLILEMKKGIDDWGILNQIKSKEIDVTKFRFETKVYTDVTTPLVLQEEYLKPLRNRWKELDIQIYKYLWKNTDGKQILSTIYWVLQYVHSAQQVMEPIYQHANKIRQSLAFYHSHGGEVRIDSDVRDILAGQFWEFLRPFDFVSASLAFGGCKRNDGVLVNDLLTKWQKYANHAPLLGDEELLEIIDDVWKFLEYMSSTAEVQWKELVIQAYEKSQNKD